MAAPTGPASLPEPRRNSTPSSRSRRTRCGLWATAASSASTADGGINWATQVSGTAQNLSAITAASPTVLWAAGGAGNVVGTTKRDELGLAEQHGVGPVCDLGGQHQLRARVRPCRLHGVDGQRRRHVGHGLHTHRPATQRGLLLERRHRLGGWQHRHRHANDQRGRLVVGAASGNGEPDGRPLRRRHHRMGGRYRWPNHQVDRRWRHVGRPVLGHRQRAQRCVVHLPYDRRGSGRRRNDPAHDQRWYHLGDGHFRTTQILNGVRFTNASTGWVVGNGGVIRKSVDGGATWTAQTSGITTRLASVSCVDVNNAFVSGNGGAVRKTVNGGTAWTAVTSGTTQNIGSISMVSATTGWYVANTGLIYKTVDGATWAPPNLRNHQQPAGGVGGQCDEREGRGSRRRDPAHHRWSQLDLRRVRHSEPSVRDQHG